MSDAQPPLQAIRTLQARKRIALIAHDGKKSEMLEWATRWQSTLSQHELIGTGTTAGRLKTALGLSVEGLMSGPLGGDQQIGARIAEQRLDRVDLLLASLLAAAPRPGCQSTAALSRAVERSRRLQCGQRRFLALIALLERKLRHVDSGCQRLGPSD